MSRRRHAVCFVIAAMLVTALPAVAALADTEVQRNPASQVRPHWFDTIVQWLHLSTVARFVSSSEAGPGLDPNGPPVMTLLDPSESGDSSGTSSDPDGERGPTLDPDG